MTASSIINAATGSSYALITVLLVVLGTSDRQRPSGRHRAVRTAS